ncbi:MAG: hypothetical protein ACQESH_03930 [Campylobacterota bacterium]
MIKLEYVGNKPIITPKSVSFITSKHDKYDYIEPASHVLERLYDLEEDTLAINPKKFYDQEHILQILFQARPDFEAFFEQQLQKYVAKIDEESQDVEQYKTLKEIEKRTLQNNYEFMRPLRIQRATNKIVYENIINECVKLLKQKRVKEVSTPFSENFMHVCNSLSTTIELNYRQVDAEVKVMLDGGQPYAKVFINYN